VRPFARARLLGEFKSRGNFADDLARMLSGSSLLPLSMLAHATFEELSVETRDGMR